MPFSHSISAREIVSEESMLSFPSRQNCAYCPSLAYSEMRLILALIIFNFDMKIADESRDWIIQKNFLMWQKGPLKVYLTPRTEAFVTLNR